MASVITLAIAQRGSLDYIVKQVDKAERIAPSMSTLQRYENVEF